MMLSNRTCVAAGVAALSCLAAASSSPASVMLGFSDYDATPTAVTVAPNGSFDVHIVLTVSGTDKVSGVDYSFTSYKGSTAVSDLFQVASRSQTSAQAGVFTPNASSFQPRNLAPRYAANLGGFVPTDTDLGAQPLPYDLVTYTINVLNAPNGVYTFQISAPPGLTSPTYSGARDVTGTSSDFPLSSTGTFTVTIPEPTTLAALGGVGLVALRRRRALR